jgi:hypothetical protein
MGRTTGTARQAEGAEGSKRIGGCGVRRTGTAAVGRARPDGNSKRRFRQRRKREFQRSRRRRPGSVRPPVQIFHDPVTGAQTFIEATQRLVRIPTIAGIVPRLSRQRRPIHRAPFDCSPVASADLPRRPCCFLPNRPPAGPARFCTVAESTQNTGLQSGILAQPSGSASERKCRYREGLSDMRVVLGRYCRASMAVLSCEFAGESGDRNKERGHDP